MIKIFLIIWLLVGFITAWRLYHGYLKSWYDEYGESFHDSDKAESFLVWVFTISLSPITIAGGFISFIMFNITLVSKTPQCWWFTTKNK